MKPCHHSFEMPLSFFPNEAPVSPLNQRSAETTSGSVCKASTSVSKKPEVVEKEQADPELQEGCLFEKNVLKVCSH